MKKKDSYLPGIRVSSDLAQEFNRVKQDADENLSEIGRELVRDYIRIHLAGEKIVRPARFVTEVARKRLTPTEAA